MSNTEEGKGRAEGVCSDCCAALDLQRVLPKGVPTHRPLDEGDCSSSNCDVGMTHHQFADTSQETASHDTTVKGTAASRDLPTVATHKGPFAILPCRSRLFMKADVVC